MPLSRCFACLVLGAVLSFSNGLQAAVVVITNTTDQTISFELSHPKGEVRKEQLPARECRTYPVGQQPEIAFTLGGAAEIAGGGFAAMEAAAWESGTHPRPQPLAR